jgi:hypothetical protein
MTERKQRKQEPKRGPKLDPKLDEDLRQNPGIGQAKGAYAMGGNLDYAEGDNTVEGDVENDPDALGRVPENRLGRTNR